MKKIVLLMLSLSFLSLNSAWASDEQMKETLVKIIQSLQAMKPLIDEASREQPANPRVMLHFESWQDNAGHAHSGLKADLDAIQQALMTAVNRETIEPRVFAPLDQDFVGDRHV